MTLQNTLLPMLSSDEAQFVAVLLAAGAAMLIANRSVAVAAAAAAGLTVAALEA